MWSMAKSGLQALAKSFAVWKCNTFHRSLHQPYRQWTRKGYVRWKGCNVCHRAHWKV